MPERLHLIVMSEGLYGHSVTSPQVPGFVYGRPGDKLDRKDLEGALRFAEAPDLPWALHVARRDTGADGIPYTIRVASDDKHERFRTAWLLGQTLQGSEQGEQMLATSPTTHGEVQFVCVLPDDLIGWMIEQVDDRPEQMVMVMPVGEDSLQTLPISSDAILGWPAIELPMTATIADLMDSTDLIDHRPGVLIGA